MREIKFRIYDKVSERMLVQSGQWYFNQEYDELAFMMSECTYNPESNLEIMQYTGLKDKNGKEIYEGDIVKGKNYGFNNPIRYIGTVEYVYNKFKVIGCRNKYKGTNDELNTIYEVIGNIYENPDLVQL